ncbi:MAG: aspartate--tRNA ligase [Oscillospiraceae bacterium]|nr:aspartate--tRNA ligase [Oscillospiraceae bacterium]
MYYNKRTHYCGGIGPEQIGREVILCGWVQRQRDLGGLIFIDLRDRAGVAQCVFDHTVSKEIFDLAFGVRSESVLCVRGEVRARSNPNPNIPTGAVEVLASGMELLSRAQTPPFEIGDDRVSEPLRLEHRYLDLRGPKLQGYMRLRHDITQSVRRFYDQNGFYEIETPLLTKSTPEGARDYLVPSRLYPGRFYALPQSPQQYKQLLMVSGVDRYFQIARCMRDEDLRADRQPDFTQIDVEMSFVDIDDVLDMNERMMAAVFKDVIGVDIPLPMKRMPYREAVERFGTDKPDLRFGFELKDLTAVTRACGFSVFEDAAMVGCVVIEGAAAEFTRKRLDRLTEFIKGLGPKGLAWHKGAESSSFAKLLSPEALAAVEDAAGFRGERGDLLLAVAGQRPALVRSSLGALRCECAKQLGLLENNRSFEFVWITEFPLFEYSEEEGRYVACHHPFTNPMAEDIHLIDKPGGLGQCRARAYDMVLNGYELCSGSIRIHDAGLQAKMFELLQLTPEQTERRFGHILKAFGYGVPPHGGVGFGLDRIVMIMAGTENIRDVIAFPKTQNAVELMMGAPDYVDGRQLEELSIRVVSEQ